MSAPMGMDSALLLAAVFSGLSILACVTVLVLAKRDHARRNKERAV